MTIHHEAKKKLIATHANSEISPTHSQHRTSHFLIATRNASVGLRFSRRLRGEYSSFPAHDSPACPPGSWRACPPKRYVFAKAGHGSRRGNYCRTQWKGFSMNWKSYRCSSVPGQSTLVTRALPANLCPSLARNTLTTASTSSGARQPQRKPVEPAFSVAVIRSNSFFVESILFNVSIPRRRTRGSGRGPWWLKAISSASLFSSASKSTG